MWETLRNPHLVPDPFHYWCGNKSARSLLTNPSCFCEHLLGTFNLCRSRYQFFQLSGHTDTKNIFTYCKKLGEIVHKVGLLMLLYAIKTCPVVQSPRWGVYPLLFGSKSFLKLHLKCVCFFVFFWRAFLFFCKNVAPNLLSTLHIMAYSVQTANKLTQ